MNVLQRMLNTLKRPAGVVLVVILVVSAILGTLSYRFVVQSPAQRSLVLPQTKKSQPTPKVTHLPTATATASPLILPVQDAAHILGVEGNPDISYTGVPWVRLAHPSCGWGNLRGSVLKDSIQAYHAKGIRVLFTLCQSNSVNIYDTNLLNDAAQGNPDAVQCGNEQMKQDASVSFLYIQPEDFAKFYDLCEHTMHAVRPDIPVLLGSLDPHVAANDYQLLANQVNYLDQMQNAMNSVVHPGGNWDWRNQTLGLIDSWHNGYYGVNNLYDLYAFWAQQFHIDLNSGQLGKHLWVVEGTGCFKGCGIDVKRADQVAIAHILTLITDVQTTQKYQVPFFYFSGKDFFDQGINWPIGILTSNGEPKPIRQDLAMGARTLTLSCPDGNVSVSDQGTLLAKLYNYCSLPSDYLATIKS